MDDVHLGILMPTMYISRALYSIPGVSRLPKSIRGGGGRSLTLMDLRAAEGATGSTRDGVAGRRLPSTALGRGIILLNEAVA